MKDTSWEISQEDLSNYYIDENLNGPQTFSDKELKKIVGNVQYLSMHPVNKWMDTQEKIAYFNSYTKSRMDFLADIATTTPTMESSKRFYGELIAGIDRNRILLDNISGIDDFKYRIDLFDCRRNKDQAKRVKKRKKITTLEDDFSVAVPNDIIGQHAFYIILENLIRNTAKHSGKEDNSLVTFNIEVHEPDEQQCKRCPKLNSYYEIHIYDDFPFETLKVRLTGPEADFFKKYHVHKLRRKLVTPDLMIDKLEKIVHRQNVFINQDLLSIKENTLRQGAWGMVEMEAAAAYLRKIPVESIDEDRYEIDIDDLKGKDYGILDEDYRSANILKCFIKVSNDQSRTRHLAYRFFMLKPKELLIVVDDDVLSKLDKREKTLDYSKLSTNLINHGIWLKYDGEKRKDGLEKFEKNHIYEHEILVNMTNGDIPSKEDISSKFGLLPDKIIRFSIIEYLKANFKKEDALKVKDVVWKRYSETLPDIYVFPYQQTHFPNIHEPLAKVNAEYTHHGTSWSDAFGGFIKNTRQHIEITTGLNNMSDTLKKAFDGGKAFYKLLDSINSQIIIFDERVQEAAAKLTYTPESRGKTFDEVSYAELYIASGVYVPPKGVFDFSKIAYKKDTKGQTPKNQILELLRNSSSVKFKKYLECNLDRVRFLVMHLGVLEKILVSENARVSDPSKEKDIIEDLVNEFLASIPRSEGQEIKPIIISGRGLPPNLPGKIPFVNYSALSQYLIDNRNKYLLNDLLFSTRNVLKLS